MGYKRKYEPSHKKVNLAGKLITVEGKLKPKINSPQLMDFFLGAYGHEGDLFSIELSLKRPKRSESQNAYLHIYLHLISLSSAHTPQELKDWIQQDDRILGQGITEMFETKVRKVLHTSDLNISEFVEMMHRIQEVTEIPLPDPEPFGLPMTIDEYNKLVIDEKINYSKMQSRI